MEKFNLTLRYLIFSCVLCVTILSSSNLFSQTDGIPTIVNSEPTKIESYQLKKLWHWGADKEDPVFFSDIRKVLVDSFGDIIVVNYSLGGSTVWQLAPDGLPLLELSRDGAGPDEYSKAYDAFLIPANEDFPNNEHVGIVSRFGKMKVTVAKIGYSIEDQYPKMPDYSFMKEGESYFGMLNVKRLESSRHIFLRDSHIAGGTAARFKRYLSTTDSTKTITNFAEHTYIIPDPGDAFETEFDRFNGKWDANEDLVFLATTDDYSIAVFDAESGKSLYKIERVVERCNRSSEENKYIKTFYYDKYKRHAKGVNIVPRKKHPAITSIQLMADGNLWVQTISAPCSNDKHSLGVFDVYDIDGHLLKQVRFNSDSTTMGMQNFNRLLLTRDRLYMTVISEGNPSLAAFELPAEIKLESDIVIGK